MKLGELATRLGAELRGDAELEVTGVQGIEEAGATEITFVANPRYAGLARTTRAAAVLVEPEFPEITTATLRLKNPYLAFARALGLFYQAPVYPPGIHPTAVIDSTAEIGEGAHIGAYVVVGPGCRLGDHATLLPHVVLYPGVQAGDYLFAHAHSIVRERCVLGDHVTLENGAIIGSDGFGFAKNEAGHWEKIPQSGAGADRQPGGCPGQCLHRPGHGRRDADRRWKQGGQPGAGGPRFTGRRKYTAVCTGWTGRLLDGGKQRDLSRTGGGSRTLHAGRWGDSDGAVGSFARRSRRQDDFRLAGVRQPGVAAGSDAVSTAAGIAEAYRPSGEEARCSATRG